MNELAFKGKEYEFGRGEKKVVLRETAVLGRRKVRYTIDYKNRVVFAELSI